MSLDLYQDEIRDQLAGMPPVTRPETGAFDGFIRGTGLATMRGFARAARVVDLAGSVGRIAQDALLGTGTEAQDRYFKEHDDVFGSAVQHWAPEPGEVGAAADVVGGLLSTIPLVLLSPGLAAASTADIGEELVQKGVPAGKAAGVATAQAAGMALGIWMPVLGQNLWQRVFIGGAGFNALQGVTMRGASGAILEGTPAADEFKAFDGKQLTLDVLMGMAFGTLAHISPAQRAQGEVYWDRLLNWAKDLDPSQKDAVLALRQAEHMNVDSAPGKLAGSQDVEAHVQRMRQAIDQLAKGDQVAVDDLPAPKFEPDARKAAAAEKTVADLQKIAEKVRVEEGIAEPPIVAFRKEAADLESTLPPLEDGMTRLWRGNRPGEVGQNPSFTSSLPGIALPFRKAYGGELSYVDVPTADLPKYPHGPAATDAEFILPSDLAAKAKAVQRAESPAAEPGIVAFHGTKAEPFSQFDDATSGRANGRGRGAGLGFWFSADREAAAIFSRVGKGEERIVEAELGLKNPYEMTTAGLTRLMLESQHLDPEGQWQAMREFRERLRANGFDGILVKAQLEPTKISVPESARAVVGAEEIDIPAAPKGTEGAGDRYVVFDPKKIKMKTEAPAAKPGGTEPPPPRGSRGAEAAGAEADPVAMEAQRLAEEQPDLRLNLGTTADGQPVTTTAKQFLEDTKAETSKLREQAKLVMVAAQCMLGVL